MSEEALSLETKQRPWWLTLVGGILAIIVGGLLLWAGLYTKIQVIEFLVIALGIYWLVDGIFTLVSMFVDHTAWGWKLLIGVISIIAGLVLIMSPILSGIIVIKTLLLLIGIWGVIDGIVLLVLAFKGGGWGAAILGVITIILGIVLILNYNQAGMVIATIWLGAIAGLVGGVLMIVKAFQQRAA
jgi:uncharacterized membrane protein HdeD (DUF308 family)